MNRSEKGLRGGLVDDPARAFDPSAHAFVVPGTVPGTEESLALAAAWPSEESITLVYAEPQGTCRGTTAGAWRLADERDARDLGTGHVTLIARAGDCPVDAVPLLALRGVVPADVEFIPPASKGLEAASIDGALRREVAKDAAALSVDGAFLVGGNGYAAVMVRIAGDMVARPVLVPLRRERGTPVTPLNGKEDRVR